ncbi:MAG TPA: hypothetical protein VGJ60_19670 [Chloroflexota bacterium]|jgi:hypothetical protein
MTVVFDEFEVVPGAEPRATQNAQPQAQAAPPAEASPADLDAMLRHIIERSARVAAH